jgi:hypothetical protein
MTMDLQTFFAENGFTIKNVVLDEWFGRMGYGLFGAFDGKEFQISDTLGSVEAVHHWAETRRALLASIAGKGMTPPSETLVSIYRERLSARLSNLEERAAQTQQSIQRFEGQLAYLTPGELSYLEQDREDAAAHEIALARIRNSISRCDVDPASLFFPLGSTVRLNKDYRVHQMKDVSGGGLSDVRPVEGQVGVVKGMPDRGEFSVTVAFYGDVNCINGVEEIDFGRPELLTIPAEDLEVVGLARTVDGELFRSADLKRTHIDEEYDEDVAHMVLMVNGMPWHYTGFNLDNGRDHSITVRPVADMDALDHLAKYDPENAAMSLKI